MQGGAQTTTKRGSGGKGGFSLSTTLLGVNTFILVVFVVYVWLRPGGPLSGVSVGDRRDTDTAPTSVRSEPTSGLLGTDMVTDTVSGRQAFEAAQEGYAAGKFEAALADYRKALGGLGEEPGSRRLAEFMRYRIAQCMERTGSAGRAAGILRELKDARSWAVGLASRYSLGRIAYDQGEYMAAWGLACEVLALAEVLPESERLTRDATYLAAASLTRQALPEEEGISARVGQVVKAPGRTDVLDAWKGEELDAYLERGRIDYTKRMVARRLAVEVDGEGKVEVISHGAPLEEVLTQICQATGYRLSWEGTSEAARRREVHVIASGRQVAAAAGLACGAAGLFTVSSGEGVKVVDAGSLFTPEARRAFLIDEALGSWRSFVFRYGKDEAAPIGYFAVAGLDAARGEVPAAVTQLRLIVRRYPESEAAQAGMLAGAELLGGVGDYEGAGGLLKDLIDTYPCSRLAGEAYLELGRVTWKGGSAEEAVKVLRKTGHLEFSAEITRQAVLELGRATFALGRYEEAVGWLEHYQASYPGAAEQAEVALLLGRALSARGDYEAAVKSLARGWEADKGGAFGVESMLEMAEAERMRGRYTAALNALDVATEAEADRERLGRLMLLRAKVLTDMGLDEPAVEILKQELARSAPEHLKVAFGLALGDALMRLERWGEARDALTELMLEAGSARDSEKLALGLARAYSGEGRYEEAIAFAEGLLGKADFEGRREAREVLWRAYEANGDVRKAALCLAGVWEGEGQ